MQQGMRAIPVASYGLVMAVAGFACALLECALEQAEGPTSRVRNLLGSRLKEWISLGGHATGIAASFDSPMLSLGIHFLVTAWWFVPDRRFETGAIGTRRSNRSMQLSSKKRIVRANRPDVQED